jgi:ubiquinone biosynthesis protein Coq4
LIHWRWWRIIWSDKNRTSQKSGERGITPTVAVGMESVMDDLVTSPVSSEIDDSIPTSLATSTFVANPQPPLARAPLPEPGDDVRPRQGMPAEQSRYLQGDALPVTSSVLTSNSKYLNNPIYRDAFATQALRRHGHDLPPTYMVPIMVRSFQETNDYPRLMALLDAEKTRVPALGEWIDAREDFTFKRDELADYAAGTLGHAIYKFLGIPGVNMEFSSDGKVVQSDFEYLGKRRGYFHDIEHMVTGFSANTAGEAALSIMNATQDARFFTPELAQYMSQGNMWVTSTGLYRTGLHYHHALPTYLDAVQQGIAAGLALRQPMFTMRWNRYLDWQLDDIAAYLGFKRGPGSAWDWTTDATNG